MSGGGGSTVGRMLPGVGTALGTNTLAMQAYIPAVMGARAGKIRGAGGEMLQASNPLQEPEMPDQTTLPTMEDIAAKEPDKERRRRQRLAALMAQGRQGTILTGPMGISPNNSVGGGGKQLAGA